MSTVTIGWQGGLEPWDQRGMASKAVRVTAKPGLDTKHFLYIETHRTTELSGHQTAAIEAHGKF